MLNARLWLVSWCLTIFIVSSQGQDPVFSRYSVHMEQENPAFAGALRQTTAYAVYRNQYPQISTDYVSYAIGGATYLPDLRSGVGISMLFDDSADGFYQNLMVKVNYSYRLPISSNAHLNAGISIGYGRTDINFDRYIFPDQLDPVLGPISPGGTPFPSDELQPAEESADFIDMGAGVILQKPDYYIGFSLHHLNNPNNDFLVSSSNSEITADGLPMRWSFAAGYTLVLLESPRERIWAYHPQVLYTRQADLSQLQIGQFLSYRDFDFGLAYRLSGRTSDALIISAGIGWDHIDIYYAYDLTISSLANRSGGAHEIGIGLRIGEPTEGSVDCFDFYR